VKAFVVDGADAAVREWPEPVVGPGEVLVRPLRVGLCGTDLELIDATIDPTYVRYPLVLGHEWVGRLDGDVAGVAPAGTVVVVEGVVPDGTCAACVRGESNLCAVYDEIGFTRPGALAEALSVPSFLVHPLERTVELEDAVLVEPMAVVWRALTRVPLRPGLRVAVVGDGTVALLAAHLVQLFEPADTTLIGRRDEQASLALAAGAKEFVTSSSDSFDLVIEAAGSADAVEAALGHCARGGMVILLGLPPHGTTVTFAPDDLVNNDQIVQGSFSYTRRAFAEVVERLNRGALRPGFLVTHRFALADAHAAVATLRGGASHEPRGKVIVDLER
jgi:threonine dehydrogenase-like Zn-dependent dehydrogenase